MFGINCFEFDVRWHGITDGCIVWWGSYPPATSAKQPPISTPRVARGRQEGGDGGWGRLSGASIRNKRVIQASH